MHALASVPVQVVSIYYMVFSRVTLAHPRSRYGKGFLVAASFYTAMHLANIAAQVRSSPHVARAAACCMPLCPSYWPSTC